MASSQVEIASSSPFGCVLKDHNRRDHRLRDSNSNPNSNNNNNNVKTNSTTFQKNLKEIVRDHLSSCISISSSDQNCDENSNTCRPNNVNGNTNFMTSRNGHHHHRSNNLHSTTSQKCKKDDEEPLVLSHRQSRVLDRWAAQQAKEMINTIERQNHEAAELMAHSNSNSVSSRSSTAVIKKRETSPAPSDTSSMDVSVSSLVQKWRGYTEAKQRQNRKKVNGNYQIQSNTTTSSATNNANVNRTTAENNSSDDDARSGLQSNNNINDSQSPCYNNEVESIVDWESIQSDKTSLNDQVSESRSSRISDGSETDRLRVVDMVRKWANSNPCGENDQEHHQQNQPSPVVTPLARLIVDQGGANKGAFGPPVLGSPRLIRGRQAIADLFTKMERDRQMEVEGLASRQAVTKFPQRGRIQSLLKLRFLRREGAVQEQRHPPQAQARSTESNRSQHAAAISSLREKFNTASEIEFASSNTTTKDRTGATPEQDCTSPSKKAKETLTNTVPAENGSTCSNAREVPECKFISSKANERVINTISENDSITNSRQSSTSVHDSVQSNARDSRRGTASEDDSVKSKSRERLSAATSEHNLAISNTRARSSPTSKHDSTASNAEESSLHTRRDEHDSVSSCSSTKDQTTTEQEFTLLRTLRERLRPASEPDSTNMQCSKSDSLNDKGVEKASSSDQQSPEEICQPEPKTQVHPSSASVKNMGVSHATDGALNLIENQQESTVSSQVIDDTVRSDDFRTTENLVQNTVSQEETEDLHGEILSAVGYEGGIVSLDSEEMEYATTSYNDWEEEYCTIPEDQETSSQYFQGINLDWISEIARPRSYWEDRRQAWYQEIFDNSSTNEDIRRLIEKRTVSGVLASDFRERMDRLMMSNAQRYMHSEETDQNEDDDRSMGAFLRRHMQQSWSSTQEQHQILGQSSSTIVGCQEVHEEQQQEREQEGHQHPQEEDQVENIEEDDHDDDIDEDEDVENSLLDTPHYNDDGDYYEGTPSSVQLPWSSYHNHHEGSEEDSDQAASTPFHQTSIVHSCDHDTHEGSSLKNGSIEMELIYDLRVHMEQIYREMSELRKSINSCMDMQMNLHHSIRKEVTAAISDSDRLRQEGKESNQKVPKGGSCCICCEKKVDSLLYRCGHMCTCFKCAHELHRSSGKCPICRAQIVDVVRAYPHA